MSSIRATLNDEVRTIILQHLGDLGQYLPSAKEIDEQIPETVLSCLERLTQICQYSPESAPPDLYREACNNLGELEAFLKSMNQFTNREFRETAVGQVWAEANHWHRSASQQYQLTTQEVWQLIAPAQPDHLEDLGDGSYEARWWKPVPVMDIEILKYTDGVLIDDAPFEPKTLPGGLALRFSVCITA